MKFFFRLILIWRLKVICDVDWASAPNDRISSSGYCKFFCGIVSWRTKNKLLLLEGVWSNCKNMSKVSVNEMCHSWFWFCFVLTQTQLHCDQANIHMANNPDIQKRTKHIEIYCQEKVTTILITIPFIQLKDQWALTFSPM